MQVIITYSTQKVLKYSSLKYRHFLKVFTKDSNINFGMKIFFSTTTHIKLRYSGVFFGNSFAISLQYLPVVSVLLFRIVTYCSNWNGPVCYMWQLLHARICNGMTNSVIYLNLANVSNVACCQTEFPKSPILVFKKLTWSS